MWEKIFSCQTCQSSLSSTVDWITKHALRARMQRTHAGVNTLVRAVVPFHVIAYLRQFLICRGGSAGVVCCGGNCRALCCFFT